MQTKSSRLIYSVIALLALILTIGICSADGVNVEFASHFGGIVSDVAVAGNYAYIGQGQDLVVLDITDVSNPSEVGKVITPSIVTGIELAGNYAYIANYEYGLVIVDITDPSAPILVSGYDTGYAFDVAVSGNYAYVADGSNLLILDISNPSAPTFAGSYYTGFSYKITVAGNYAYLTDWVNLLILDISDPSAPTLIGSYDNISVAAIDVAGNYAYVIDGINLVILDISDPSAPTLVSSYEIGSAVSVFVAGNYAYIADWGSDLIIMDITDPSAPTLVNSYDTGGHVSAVAVAGNYAYIAEGEDGLLIVDIEDTSAATLVGSYYSGYATDVTLAGNYAYVAYYSKGLMIVDITDPFSPKLMGSYDTDGYAHAVAVSGDYAYVADDEKGIVIIDITDPSAPSLVGIYDTDGYANDIALSGNYAYIADGFNGLVIVDITDPFLPTLVGSYATDGDAFGIKLSNNYAYIACENGLVIVDITDPSAPTLAGSYDTVGPVSNVAVVGNYAYLTEWFFILILDISDPSAPTLENSYDIGGPVTVAGNYAYIGNDEYGLVILDISDPLAPIFVGSWYTAGHAADVAFSNNHAYVADGNNGLVTFSIEKPASISYTPVYDNRLRASLPNTVLSTTTYIDIGKSTSSSRDVLLFDLSAYKSTDIISKATLSLYWYYPPSATRTSDTVVEVYRPVEWDPKYVTWNTRMSGVPWTIAGGNWYDKNGVAQGTTPYASVTFKASTVPDNKYYEFDVTQLVQEYVDETYENTGFFLKAKTESGNYIAFYSSDWSNDAQKPKLTVSTASVDNPPVAEAGPDQVATTGSVVTFDGSNSTDDKGIVSYSWDFDDGTHYEAATAIATHTYAAAGTYNVMLTVTDTVGQTNSDTLQVIVSSPTTTVTYTPDYDNRLRASSPNTVLSTTTYIDIGKSTSNSRGVLLFDLCAYKPTDTISKATLSLYWYYPPSATRTSDTVVEVYRPVEWDPKYVTWNTRMSGVPWTVAGGNWYDKNGVAQGTTPYASVTFKASTVPDNKYYEFDVTQLVQEYVDETYENTGFFLKAKTESGNYIAFYSSDWSNDAQKPKLTVSTASVDNPPVAEAGPDQVATTGSVATFDGSNSTDDKGIVSYSWDFDASNGITTEATGVTATKTYATAGNYTVTLTVTDTIGQKSSDTLKVVVTSLTSIYTPIYDNRLRASSPNTVLSTTTYIDIGKSTSSSRDVLLFDLSAYKPTDIISKATLSLYWYYPPSATRTSDTVVEVYRPVEWDPNYVTWNTRMSGVPWTTAGGNWYDKNGVAQGTTPYASATFKASTVPDNKYYEFDVTQLVQEYVDETYENTGFFLKAKTESGNYIAFYSSDWSNDAQKPKLTITR